MPPLTRKRRARKLERRHREPVTERDRHAVQFLPVLRDDRRGAVAKLGGDAVHQAELLEKGAVTFNAHVERHLGRADIRRIDEDFRHGEAPSLAVEVVDGEGGVVDRARCVVVRAQRRLPAVEHAGDGEHLEHRAHLVDAEADAIEPLLVEGLLAMIGVSRGARRAPSLRLSERR